MDLKDYYYNGAAIVGSVSDVSKDKKEENVSDETLKRYIDEQEIFTVRITGKTVDSVTTKIFGLMGIIPIQQVSNRMYIRNNAEDLIGQNVPVLVKSFDLEKGTITLSRAKAIEKLREGFFNEVIGKLNDINKNGVNYKKYLGHAEEDDPHFNDYPVVKAKIIQQNKAGTKLILNIAGLDIIGVLDISKLDYRYIYDTEQYMKEHLNSNRVIDVALLAYFKNEGKPANIVCSRRHTLKNPWKGLEEKIKKDDILVVTATDRRDNHFFGEYDNFPLDIKCYYPDPEMWSENNKHGRRLIMPGEQYKVRVHIVNPEKRLLTAKTIGKL